MLTIEIRNVHTKGNIADYTYRVFINDRFIDKGIYRGHNRKDGWAKLVHDIAELHLNQS